MSTPTDLIRGFLDGSYQYVCVGSKFSSEPPVHNGMLQGTLLGLMLWLLYVGSLIVNYGIIKYADDLLLTAKSAKNPDQPPDIRPFVD